MKQKQKRIKQQKHNWKKINVSLVCLIRIRQEPVLPCMALDGMILAAGSEPVRHEQVISDAGG